MKHRWVHAPLNQAEVGFRVHGHEIVKVDDRTRSFGIDKKCRTIPNRMLHAGEYKMVLIRIPEYLMKRNG